MKYKWIAILVVLLLVGWLWVSWRNAWFPFGAPSAITPQQIADSLTATGTPMNTANATDTLKSLTPTSPAKPTAGTIKSNASILDSLTPKK